jgi:hypothetical protein
MLHVGLDLSPRRVDVCLISSEGDLVEHFRAPADRDGLYGLTRRVAVYEESVREVVESMNGARFVRDKLVRYRWEVLSLTRSGSKGWRRWRARPNAEAPCRIPGAAGGTRREVLWVQFGYIEYWFRRLLGFAYLGSAIVHLALYR